MFKTVISDSCHQYFHVGIFKLEYDAKIVREYGASVRLQFHLRRHIPAHYLECDWSNEESQNDVTKVIIDK